MGISNNSRILLLSLRRFTMNTYRLSYIKLTPRSMSTLKIEYIQSEKRLNPNKLTRYEYNETSQITYAVVCDIINED